MEHDTCIARSDWASQGCIRMGVGGRDLKRGWGVWLGPPLLPGSPYGPRRRQAEQLGSVNPLGTEGAEAKFWLSASNIGRGGGGVRGGVPPSPSCGVRPFSYITGASLMHCIGTQGTT